MRHVLSTSLLAATTVAAQAPAAPASSTAAGTPLPIQDNSFLVEEAYNQDRGVVQHVATFRRDARGRGWASDFTQEWPVGGRRHQLSYTVPVSHTASDATDFEGVAPGAKRTGVGDVALHYRYQANAAGAATLFAPRATVLLPTGASRQGRGAGGVGLQVNLPLTAEWPRHLVTHTNAGATFTPRARDTGGGAATSATVALGQSLVWLARPKLNLLLEAVWSRAQDVTGPGRTAWGSELLLSPGVRGAVDLPSGMQIVPGLAFPVGVGSSRGERGVFAYLSVEHAFARQGP